MRLGDKVILLPFAKRLIKAGRPILGGTCLASPLVIFVILVVVIQIYERNKKLKPGDKVIVIARQDENAIGTVKGSSPPLITVIFESEEGIKEEEYFEFNLKRVKKAGRKIKP